MKRTNRELNDILDRVSSDIRSESIDPSTVRGAADRVLTNLSSEQDAAVPQIAYVDHIRGCEDFQKLIPSYLRGSLSSARTMLLEDHTQECIPCRKALKQARLGGRVVARPLDRPSPMISRFAVKWAVAAALIVAVSVVSAVLVRRSGRSAHAVYAMVESVYGPVYRVSDTASETVLSSQQLKAGEKIRTARDAGAVVRLPDGSAIEMKERSEFSVTESSKGVTIHLERGNIIVQAAKQHDHLFVQTNDCVVSVKGTIFSVNNGTKGSRVSVIEGEVHVDHDGEKDVLHPGDQVATSDSIDPIPVKDEISWSRDSERYSKMLAEIEAIRKEIDEKAPRPAIRYSTRLLDMVPDNTVLYVALPNLSATLAESRRIMEERIHQNPALGEWWQKEQGSRSVLNHVIDKIHEVGEYVGDEIVVSATMNAQGEPDDPIVLAELKDASGFRSYLEQQITAANAVVKGPVVRFIDDPMSPSELAPASQKSRDSIIIWINGDVFAAAPNVASLRKVAVAARKAGAKGFTHTPFYERIAELYRDGTGLIVAADLQAIMGGTGGSRFGNGRESEAFQQLGITNLKHFIFEIKETGGKAQNRAVVTFDQAERGLASWLAAPGPMGALQFISPDANVVAAFVVKQPVALVDDLLGALRTLDPSLWQHLKDGEAEHGIDIRNDFAAPLGGEFAFAIDGPLLPVPSWKLVFEVNDPAHLQQTFERIVDKLNEYAAREGKQGFAWEQSEIGGRTYYTLKSVDFGLSVTYTYTNGYLIAGPNRPLVDLAVRNSEAGRTLLVAPRFMAALPEDKNANFSALFYQNLAPVVGTVARGLGASAKGLPEEGQNTLRSLAKSAPVLAYAYAQGDRIIFSVNGEDGPIGLNPSSLMGLPGSFGLKQIFGESKH